MKFSLLKNAKKMMAVFLTAVITATQVPSFQGGFVKEVAAAEYTGDSWAKPYLNNLYYRGIMRGDQTGNLNPEREITRAEFVSILNRGLGYDYSNIGDKIPFRDVTGTEWYADDINLAYNMGYFAGNAQSTAGAEDSLTREQSVALICRNLKVEDVKGEVLEFTDSRSFNDWSRGSIAAAAQKGYVNGYSDGTFRPFNNITRGEAAKIFSDAFGELITQPGETSLGEVLGNVTVATSGVTLRDTIIDGDLYITNGVGTGYTTFDNVTVLGEVIISGAGESNAGDTSINFTDSSIETLTVNNMEGKIVTVRADGETFINRTVIRTDTYLEELTYGDGGFGDVELDGDEDTELHLSGAFDTVTVYGRENELYLNKGSIDNLIVDEDAVDSKVQLDRNVVVHRADMDSNATITGRGDIGTLNINASGVSTSMLPDVIIIRPGLTANIAGKIMTSQDAEESSSSPRILAGYPEVVEIEPTAVVGLFETNKPGKIYWTITLADDDEDLDDNDITIPKKSLVDIIASGTIDSKESYSELRTSISSLKSDTEYVLTAVLEDDRGDISPQKDEVFTTVDNLVPNFVSGYPKVGEAGSTYVNIDVLTTKDCKAYWVAYPVGRVAPTERELLKQKFDGEVTKGITKNLKKNIESEIKVDGLTEKQTYDFYIILSDGQNNSAMKKITITAGDETPPKFLDETPKSDKITDKSVDVKYKLDENATIYYVLCDRGAEFPAPIPPETKPPALDSKEAIQAVITANNTLKNGKATARGEVEGTLKLSGLAPEKTYDLYMVAQDRSGNTTNVIKLVIKTADVIPPTAKQEFTDTHEDEGQEPGTGEPLPETDIRIVFSEEVWDLENRSSITPESLVEHQNIKMYDLTASPLKKVEVELDLSLAKIEVDEEEGNTIITLSQYVTNLNSGNKYQIELNDIVDTSSNKMRNKTLLPEFTTVSPLVELETTVQPEDMDSTFKLNPQAVKTSDNLLFDMIIESDTNIEFDLYEKNEEGIFIPKNLSNPDYNTSILANEATTLHYILDRQINGEKTYTFERFNELTNREYGIRIISIDGNPEREGWSKTINLNIKCVMGPKTSLEVIAGNPKSGLSSAISQGAVVINTPEPFSLIIPFTDTVVPEFVSPGYPDPDYPLLDNDNNPLNGLSQVGDTVVVPIVKTTKKATFYYLIAPKGFVENPNIFDIMAEAANSSNNAMGIRGAVLGKEEIPAGDTVVEVEIEGLSPNTEYEMFCFLKGTPPETSPVTLRTFTTVDIEPPSVALEVVDRGEDYVTINITVDKDSTINWIMFPERLCPDPVTEDIILNGTESGSASNPYRPVGFGEKQVKVDPKTGTAVWSVTVTGLERNIYYNFFAIAKCTIGGPYSNPPASLASPVTPADLTPPDISIVTSISNTSIPNAPYTGNLNITFSEPVWYIEREGDRPRQLTPAKLSEQGILKVMSDGSAYIREYSPSDQNQPVKSMSIPFRNIIHNDMITLDFILCDANGNVAGTLSFRFEDKEDSSDSQRTRRSSEWTYSFVKEN